MFDSQRPSALARALGATPGQITTATACAQVGPSVIASLAGIPAGLILYAAASGNPIRASIPITALLLLIPITMLAVATLATIPAYIGAQRPVATVLRID